jgi:hypothetical protein
MTQGALMTTTALSDLLSQRQHELGLTDEMLARAAGYQSAVIRLIKAGTMRLPVNKVSAFASALQIDPVHLLKVVLLESAPGMWEVLEQFLPLGSLSRTEVNLLRHLRRLAKDRETSPVVIDGAGVIAVVVAQ